MGFQPLEVETKRPGLPLVTLSYLRPQRKGIPKKGALPQLRVYVPTTICGTTKKQHFMLEVGTGEDEGKFRMRGQNVANKITAEPVEMKNCFRFNFGYVPSFGNDIFDDVRCLAKKISDDVFEFELPEGFKITETSK